MQYVYIVVDSDNPECPVAGTFSTHEKAFSFIQENYEEQFNLTIEKQLVQ